MTTNGGWNPWRAMRHLSHGTVRWGHLPAGVRGIAEHGGSVITLDPRQTQPERRCTLTHELIHLERGPVPSCPVAAAREELAVEAEAARRLIPLDALIDALLWSYDEHELADELWVDLDMVRARLDNLTGEERAVIDERLWALEATC